jgi:excisionase family DNA binding protein
MAHPKEENLTTAAAKPALMGIVEVAAILGISPRQIRYLVRTGVLRSIRLGPTGHHRFLREDVERILRGESVNSP